MCDALVARRRARGRRRLVALVAALGLSAVACQSTDDGETTTAEVADVADAAEDATDPDPDPDANGSANDAAGSDQAPTETDLEEAQLAFEQCMADAGIDLSFGGDGESISAEIDSSDNVQLDDPGFQEAIEECDEAFEGIAGSFDPTPEQEAQLRDAEAAFSNCMADRGFEIDLGSGGGVMTFGGEGDDLEAMELAMEECSTEAFGEDGLFISGDN